MEDAILKLIVCPKCKGKLQMPTAEQHLQNATPYFWCDVCKVEFKVIDGMPNLILD